MSLAAADLIVGLIVMPISAAYAVVGTILFFFIKKIEIYLIFIVIFFYGPLSVNL